MGETWVRSLGWEDSPGEGNGNPLQYSCLENPMDREEPGGLQSTGSRRVGHDWAFRERERVGDRWEAGLPLCSWGVTVRGVGPDTKLLGQRNWGLGLGWFCFLSGLLPSLHSDPSLRGEHRWSKKGTCRLKGLLFGVYFFLFSPVWA